MDRLRLLQKLTAATTLLIGALSAALGLTFLGAGVYASFVGFHGGLFIIAAFLILGAFLSFLGYICSRQGYLALRRKMHIE